VAAPPPLSPAFVDLDENDDVVLMEKSNRNNHSYQHLQHLFEDSLIKIESLQNQVAALKSQLVSASAPSLHAALPSSSLPASLPGTFVESMSASASPACRRFGAGVEALLQKHSRRFPWIDYKAISGPSSLGEKGTYFCKACQTVFRASSIYESKLREHETAAAHVEATKTTPISTAMFSSSVSEEFHRDMAAHMASCQIRPSTFSTLYSPVVLAAIRGKGITQLLLGDTYRRNHLPDAVKHFKKYLISQFIGSVEKFSLLVDETSKNRRKVINILVTTFETRFLLDTIDFDCSKSLDGEAMAGVIIKSIKNSGLMLNLLVSVTRDGAGYMASAVRMLKSSSLTPILDVVCVSHGLALVVEYFVEPFCRAFSLLQNLRSYFINFHRVDRSRRFHSVVGLGFFSLLDWGATRPWGTYVEAVMRVFEQMEQIRNWVGEEIAHDESLNKGVNVPLLNTIRDLLNCVEVQAELSVVVCCMKRAVEALTLSQSNDAMDSIRLLRTATQVKEILSKLASSSSEDLKEMLTPQLVEFGYPVVSKFQSLAVVVQTAGQAAHAKFEERIDPALPMVRMQCWLNPFIAMKAPGELPVKISLSDCCLFATIKSTENMDLGSEWEKYKQFTANTVQPPAGQTPSKPSNGDKEAVYEWWTKHASNFPLLFKVASACFTVSVSGAEIERSFKSMRKTLPKDHSRDTMKSDLLSAECFFAYNRHLLNFFGCQNAPENDDDDETPKK
jgi:hypothetical protein